MGLNDKEVIESRKKYGNNKITKKDKESFLKKYISSLGDPIIRILIIALGIKLVFLIKDFDWFETVGIVIAILLASFISSISEYGSEKAFINLQEESSKIKCRVKRNNKVIEISIDDVVKNDLIILSSGDKVAADGMIISGSVYLDESVINGEMKENLKVKGNKIYRGTTVYSGEAIVLVTEVGDNTFYGNIAKELQVDTVESPLKIRLLKLAKIISVIGYISAFLVAFSYLFSKIVISNNFNLELIKATITNIPYMIKEILYSLTLCVTVIVVCVPEGLPMMITLVLSSNMKKMLKDNVLVRKLVGIETAGSINVLLTDKTGTLTKGKLKVNEIIDGNIHSYHKIDEISKYDKYYYLIRMSFTANNSSNYNKEAIGGNTTDRALLDFIKINNDFNIINKVPFDSKNKYSSVIVEDNGKRYNVIKGSFENIIDKCTFYFDSDGKVRVLDKIKLNKYIKDRVSKGIRAIGCMINDTLVCIVFIKDEIKEESVIGLDLISKANIITIMVTGDNKETAIAIGKEIGLVKENDIALTSEEFNKKEDYEIIRDINSIKIIARALPSDKSRLVGICQSVGLVVGMTGDGVNDAPALKKADVGFAMGSGTEVAKEASDIVILDDNLLSISKAILYGRTTFKSIRKFIIFQLTVNLCAVSLSVVGPLIGVATPVTVIQMLWINMVMDTLAGLAFSFEPPLKEYMEEKPKKRDESIINKYMFGEIIFTGIYSAILCILFLKLPLFSSFFRDNGYFLTGFFGLFIFMSIFNCFNARTHRLNLLSHLKDNIVFSIIILFIVIVQIILIYYGGNLFRTTGLNINEFIIMLLISFSVIPVDWLRKIYLRLKGEKGGV